MASTADDAARAAAERHDRHEVRMEAHAKAVERAGPMFASQKHRSEFHNGRLCGLSLHEWLVSECEGKAASWVVGFCSAISDALSDCREAADKGGDS